MTDSGQPRIEKIDATTKLAVDRTRLAYERTLMAWVRTAISLISFGFTIYKFFQIEGAGKQDGVISATEFSVLMIVFGLVSLLMATLEHRRDLNALRAEFPGNSAAIIGMGASCIDFSPGNSGVSYGAPTALGSPEVWVRSADYEPVGLWQPILSGSLRIRSWTNAGAGPLGER